MDIMRLQKKSFNDNEALLRQACYIKGVSTKGDGVLGSGLPPGFIYLETINKF